MHERSSCLIGLEYTDNPDFSVACWTCVSEECEGDQVSSKTGMQLTVVLVLIQCISSVLFILSQVGGSLRKPVHEFTPVMPLMSAPLIGTAVRTWVPPVSLHA